MDESARVLSRAAGRLDAPIMFIGEAPGRLGADASEIPFHGDQSGHNFEELLRFAGLSRSDVFVTNAVLCNPKDEKGNNAPPNRSEIKNCSSYLAEQIDFVNPAIVVTLGAVALDALKSIAPHDLSLSKSVRTAHSWHQRQLIPLYHPGQRAMLHRSMANQRSDYQFVAEQLRKVFKAPKATRGVTKTSVASIAHSILAQRGQTSYFALHKILFLVECASVAERGHPVTDAYFIRQKDGPYCTDLHLAKLRRAIPSLHVSQKNGRLLVELSHPLFGASEQAEVEESVDAIVRKIVVATNKLSDAELKTKVYLSQPMRRMLRMEKSQFVNLYNAPIDFAQAR